jgi:hypothetical protein
LCCLFLFFWSLCCLFFFFWSLCCLSFSSRILITSLWYLQTFLISNLVRTMRF